MCKEYINRPIDVWKIDFFISKNLVNVIHILKKNVEECYESEKDYIGG